MPRVSVRPTTVLLAVAAAVSLAAPAAGQEGVVRAEYLASDVEASGDQVVMTLTLRISNTSPDVMLTTAVSVDDPFAPADRELFAPDWTWARFDAGNIRNADSARLEQRIVIPHGEYTRWQQGFRPSLSVAFFDDRGAFHQLQIEAAEATEIPVGRTTF
jgi:hypothetical protein